MISQSTKPLEAKTLVAEAFAVEGERLRRHLAKRFSDIPEARREEAVGDALAELCAGRTQINDVEHARRLLYQRAESRCLDDFRRTQLQRDRLGEPTELESETEGPELSSAALDQPPAASGRTAEARWIVEAYAMLSEDERTFCRLEMVDRLKRRQIMSVTGWSEDRYQRIRSKTIASLRRLAELHASGELCRRHRTEMETVANGGSERRALLWPRLPQLTRFHIRGCHACRAEWLGHGVGLLVPPLPAMADKLDQKLAVLDRLRPGNAKAEMYSAAQRLSGSEPVSAALATSGGGPRGAGATILAVLCVAGAGASVCTGVVVLLDRLPDDKRAAVAAAPGREAAKRQSRKPIATATPAATPRRAASTQRPRTTPTAPGRSIPASAPEGSGNEFDPPADNASIKPAPADPASGGEFGP